MKNLGFYFFIFLFYSNDRGFTLTATSMDYEACVSSLFISEYKRVDRQGF